LKELFHIHPIAVEEESAPSETTEEQKKPAGEEKAKQDKGLVDEDIDET
jgi:hypothetical protein